jgi:tetratricopeptide (TPR) repeat protein
LASQASLLSTAQQHVALFNSYIKQNKLDLAADHLYAALVEKAVLQPANVFWLADYCYTRYEKDPSFAPMACVVLSRLPSAPWQERENFHLKLAKLHRNLGAAEEALSLLEKLDEQYRVDTATAWTHEKEARVCLAELYLANGAFEKAEKLFNEVASLGHYHDRFSVTAALQSVRLKIKMPFQDDLAFEKAVTCLKNLVLNKKMEHEPLYLEAALDYIELMSQKDPEKRLFLLQKMKSDFESEEDLLSKDYLAARAQFPEQSKIYLHYMQYLEAEIQFEEKSLHTKAKEILLQIRNEVKEPLLSRVESLLKKV